MAASAGASKILSLYLEVRNPRIADAGHVVSAATPHARRRAANRPSVPSMHDLPSAHAHALHHA